MSEALINLETAKTIEIEMLKEYAAFCEAHHLRYTLAYGTLLGAVRHKGFIPWDDDIDIVMPRPDYNRFLELTKDGLLSNYIRVIASLNEPNTLYPYAKLIDVRTMAVETGVRVKHTLGVWVDVFPMDGIPANKWKAALLFIRLRIFQSLLYLSIVNVNVKSWRGLLRGLLVLPSRTFNYRYLVKRIEKEAQRNKFENCDYTAVVVSGYGKREIVLKEDYLDYIALAFEGDYYKAPSNYTEYLKRLYGNYMQPPPEHKRHPTHPMKAYWKSKEGEE